MDATFAQMDATLAHMDMDATLAHMNATLAHTDPLAATKEETPAVNQPTKKFGRQLTLERRETTHTNEPARDISAARAQDMRLGASPQPIPEDPEVDEEGWPAGWVDQPPVHLP
jgi:hypothetical protein